MTTIVCAQLGMLAAGHLCTRLRRLIPDWHWSCVAPHSVGDYHLLEPGVPLLVNGHDASGDVGNDAPPGNSDRWIRLEILPYDTPLPAHTPAHNAHIQLRIAGTAPEELAGLAELICARALLAGAGEAPFVRLAGGALWQDATAIDTLARLHLGNTSPRPPAAAQQPSLVTGPAKADWLPVLAVLTAAPITPDWAAIAETLRQGDPDGCWQIEPASANPGEAKLTGHNCAIGITRHATPVPASLIEQTLAHSFWLEPGPVTRALRAHAGHFAIACDLDTTQAAPATIRQCAKAMAVIMAMLAGEAKRGGPLVGIVNAATLSAFAPGQLPMLLAPMEGDEVPIALFVASRVSGDGARGGPVSLASLGMYPFIGMEVVVDKAQGTLDEIGEQVNRVLRYLLQHGPVIGDGDTMGDGAGKPMIRCHLREASETAPTRALVLEFLK